MSADRRRPKHTKTRLLPDLPPRQHKPKGAQPQTVNQQKSHLPPPKPRRSFSSSVSGFDNKTSTEESEVALKGRRDSDDLQKIVIELPDEDEESLMSSKDRQRKEKYCIMIPAQEKTAAQPHTRQPGNGSNGDNKDKNQALVNSPSKSQRKPYSAQSSRCHQCTRPVHPQELVTVQDETFHTACLTCSICHIRLTVEGYCYIPSHDKFYCIYHYNEVNGTGAGFSDNDGDNHGVGPGVESFVKHGGDVDTQFIAVNESMKDERLAHATALAKELHLLRSRKRKLQRKEEKLNSDIKEKEESEENNQELTKLWQDLFDIMDEKNSIIKREIELSYQLKDIEMSAQHDKLERQLRAATQKQDGAKSESAKEQELLNQILRLAEKRDEMVTELNAQRANQAEAEKNLNAQKQEKGLLSAPDLIQSTASEGGKIPSEVKKQAKFACFQCSIS